MKIFVVGATGRVGQKLITFLEKQGHIVYAGARSSEKITETENIKPVFFDLQTEPEEMAAKFADAEAVYFVAGSRGKDLLQSDLYGAVKVMQAAESKGIKRYIHLSSAYALEPEQWQREGMASLMDYTIAKFFSDRWLIDNTALDYTILQPGALKETPGSCLIEISETTSGAIPIEDVAVLLGEMLERPATYQKVIKVQAGETPISEALDQL
ncbi:NAD(P)H-binding protein [Enterococcus sp. AZ094]|uniref:NAD(P)H-binding protein n=1 Tax=Enterococcus sp. AZ094 TaxID=2774702 RepID=UPI003F239AF5